MSTTIPLLDYRNVHIDQDGTITYTGIPNKKIIDVEGDSLIGVYFRGSRYFVSRTHAYWFSRFNYPESVSLDNVLFYELPHANKDGRVNIHAVFIEPVYVTPEFRLCPSRPELAVSQTGEVLRLKTGVISKGTMRRDLGDVGYMLIRVKDPTGKASNYQVHRAVANAWVLDNQDKDHPVINHKNGIKNDNRADNLEWVTDSENSFHMHASGLGNTTKPCRVRDILSGEVVSFKSSTDAATYMGVPLKLLQSSNRIRSNPFYLERYEFRYDDDNRPWYTDEYTEVMSFGSARYLFYVYEDNTKPYRKLFNGVRSVKLHYGLWKIRGTSVAVATSEDLMSEYTKRFPNGKIVCIDLHPISAIEVKNILTGVVHTYNNAAEAARSLGTEAIVIARKAKSDRLSLWYNYLIRYKSDDEWPDTENIAKSISSRMYRTIDICTNEVCDYYSQEAIANKLGCSRYCVSEAIARGKFVDRPITIIELTNFR